MFTSKVLVLARDPMVAALLGMYAELASYVPAFAEEGEQPDEALARVRPLFVVLLDGSLEAARSDLFFAQAARRRVGVAIFGPRDAAPDTGAERFRENVMRFTLPLDFDRFRTLLETAGRDQWWRRGSDRRQSPALEPRLERLDDGGLLWVDRGGHQWQVYDRRGRDRRQAPEAAPPASPPRGAPAAPDMERLFVNEAGEAWAYPLATGEPADPSVAELEMQLRLAQRV